MFSDALEDLARQLHKVLIIADAYLASSGKLSYVTERLSRAQCEYDVFSDVSPEPDLDAVTKGVKRVLEFEPDAVIGFGGGAAIDTAKAVVYFAAKSEYSKKVSLIAIPTTSGTGSEVSKYSVITNREKSIKFPLVDDSILPDAAILDARLTVSVPPQVTADTGIDVFTHAVEAFVSTERNDFTDAAAEKAIKLVKHHLLTAYREPDNLEARQGMHNASCLAGMAFSNGGLGLNHGMAHALGAHFHIPHGRANGILLPYVMSFNAGCTDSLMESAKRYAQISRLLGLESSSIRQSALNLIRTVKRYIEKMQMPSSIQAAGVTRQDFESALDDMALSAVSDSCTATNPRKCTQAEVCQVFQKAFSGTMY